MSTDWYVCACAHFDVLVQPYKSVVKFSHKSRESVYTLILDYVLHFKCISTIKSHC